MKLYSTLVTSALLLSVAAGTARAETTARLNFSEGTYYGEGDVQVEGTIVRGEWVEINYPAQRMNNLVLRRVYGSFHCYGYGPSCAPESGQIQTYYRFGWSGPFELAQGPFIQIPSYAQKLELYFYAPETLVHLSYRGESYVRATGEQYDSKGGYNYSFNF